MKKIIIIFGIIIALAIIATVALNWSRLFGSNAKQAINNHPAQVAEVTQQGNADIIHNINVRPNDTVSSPLNITGQARGNWYFEASFPVKLLDATNTVIAEGVAHTQADWMTTSYSPFTVQLTFPNPATSTGTLLLIKDNPSGLPANNDELSIPVNF